MIKSHSLQASFRVSKAGEEILMNRLDHSFFLHGTIIRTEEEEGDHSFHAQP